MSESTAAAEWAVENDVSISKVNELLTALGIPEVSTIQTVKVTVEFDLDVSDLNLLNKDALSLSGSLHGENDSDYTNYDHTESSDFNVVSIEVTG